MCRSDMEELGLYEPLADDKELEKNKGKDTKAEAKAAKPKKKAKK